MTVDAKNVGVARYLKAKWIRKKVVHVKFLVGSCDVSDGYIGNVIEQLIISLYKLLSNLTVYVKKKNPFLVKTRNNSKALSNVF